MEIKTEVKISKEELTDLIKEHYQIEGDIEFIIGKETYTQGYNDEGVIFKTKNVFDGDRKSTR